MGQLLMLFAMSFPGLARKFGIRQVTSDVSTFFLRVLRETVEKRKNNKIDRADFVQLMMNLQENSDDGKYKIYGNVPCIEVLSFCTGLERSKSRMQ